MSPESVSAELVSLSVVAVSDFVSAERVSVRVESIVVGRLTCRDETLHSRPGNWLLLRVVDLLGEFYCSLSSHFWLGLEICVSSSVSTLT